MSEPRKSLNLLRVEGIELVDIEDGGEKYARVSDLLAAGWLPPNAPPITPAVRPNASPAEVAYGLACDDRDIWKARAEAAGWRPPNTKRRAVD